METSTDQHKGGNIIGNTSSCQESLSSKSFTQYIDHTTTVTAIPINILDAFEKACQTMDVSYQRYIFPGNIVAWQQYHYILSIEDANPEDIRAMLDCANKEKTVITNNCNVLSTKIIKECMNEIQCWKTNSENFAIASKDAYATVLYVACTIGALSVVNNLAPLCDREVLRTAFCAACACGQDSVVRAFYEVQYPANFSWWDVVSDAFKGGLISACANGHLSVIRILGEARSHEEFLSKIALNTLTHSICAALVQTCYHGHFEVLNEFTCPPWSVHTWIKNQIRGPLLVNTRVKMAKGAVIGNQAHILKALATTPWNIKFTPELLAELKIDARNMGNTLILRELASDRWLNT